MDGIHNVFHISILKKYVSDPWHVIEYELLEFNKDETYQEKPIKIVDRELRQLRNKVIPLVKVIWNQHMDEDDTWETEEAMRKRYPELFTSKYTPLVQ